MRIYNTFTHYPFSSPVPVPVLNAHSPLASFPSFSSYEFLRSSFLLVLVTFNIKGRKICSALSFRVHWDGWNSSCRGAEAAEWREGTDMRLNLHQLQPSPHSPVDWGQHLKHGPAGPVSTQTRACLGLSLQVQFTHRPEYF